EKDAVWSSRGRLIQGNLSAPGDSRERKSQGVRERASPRNTIDPAVLKGAKKAPFPGFIEPCLALLVEKPPEGENWLNEIKFDGYRLMAAIQNGSVHLLTRSGLDWTGRFPGI